MTDKLNHQNLAIVLGMLRAGTTTLYHWLGQHPQVFTPWRKELLYFSRNFARGERWYRRFYSSMGDVKVGIDASPEYFMDPTSIERILNFDSKMRAILIVRDPVEWSVSMYAQLQRVKIQRDFESFLQEFNFARGGMRINVRLGSNAVRNRITEIMSAFRENVLLIDFKLLKKNPTKVLAGIENFVRLPEYYDNVGVESFQLNRCSDAPAGFVAWLLSREIAYAIVDRLASDKMMNWLRHRYYNSQRSAIVMSQCNPDQYAVALQVFGDDRQFVQQLFSKSSMVRGDGSMFHSGSLTGLDQ